MFGTNENDKHDMNEQWKWWMLNIHLNFKKWETDAENEGDENDTLILKLLLWWIEMMKMMRLLHIIRMMKMVTMTNDENS